MSTAAKPARQVQVKVIKHLPLGLFVELTDGQHGIVRVREISWDNHKRQNWQKIRPVGWSGAAVPLNSQENHPAEFSLRLAENDPWDEIPEAVDHQQMYEGIVTGVVEYGAFIELASGLTGLLHHSQLPAWVKTTSPLELFWPGDRVRVTIREIKRAERRISLGLPPLTQPTGEGWTPEKPARGFRSEKENPMGLDEFFKSKPPKSYILVVEDEPEQQMAVSNWLKHVGQHVDTAGSAEEALKFLGTSQPDLALIDVGLPGMNGAELAAMILSKWPPVRVVIATDWARADDMADFLDDLRTRGAELLPKPLLPEDLIGLLSKATEPPVALVADNLTATRPSIALTDITPLKPKSSIPDLLQQCRKQLAFEQAILFAFDPIHRLTSIAENCGHGQINEHAMPSLIYSPVRDVAEDGDTLAVNEIQPHDRDRFRYLIELYPNLVSCIGVPVSAEIQRNYALFLLDRNPKGITKEQKTYAEALAHAIGTLLEQQDFKEKSVLIQRTALIGHLTRAMVHEINNLVGPLASRLENLMTNLEILEKKQAQADTLERRNRLIGSELGEIQKGVRKIVSTTRMFGRIVSKPKNEIIRVDEIIQETIHLLRDTSDRAHVKVGLIPPQQLLIIRNQAAPLEQVLLNVMLNAVQQIAETRPDSGGWMQIRFDEETEPNRDGFFRVLIEDSGPGIHANLWEKIFEAGYTTRHDGSGIGLYISRNLVEEMAGRLYVKESYILGGTTFALEIPIQL